MEYSKTMHCVIHIWYQIPFLKFSDGCRYKILSNQLDTMYQHGYQQPTNKRNMKNSMTMYCKRILQNYWTSSPGLWRGMVGTVLKPYMINQGYSSHPRSFWPDVCRLSFDEYVEFPWPGAIFICSRWSSQPILRSHNVFSQWQRPCSAINLISWNVL